MQGFTHAVFSDTLCCLPQMQAPAVQQQQHQQQEAEEQQQEQQALASTNGSSPSLKASNQFVKRKRMDRMVKA